MKKIITVIIFLSGFIFTNQLFSQNQNIKIIDVPQLEELMKPTSSQNITVINFWATWCKPCIKELPYFVEAQAEFPEVDFIYMSLDFEENATRADKFASKKGLNPKGLYLINNLDYNSWIDKVSPEWSGAIPATLLIVDGKKYFYEKEFHEGELKSLINQKLN